MQLAVIGIFQPPQSHSTNGWQQNPTPTTYGKNLDHRYKWPGTHCASDPLDDLFLFSASACMKNKGKFPGSLSPLRIFYSRVQRVLGLLSSKSHITISANTSRPQRPESPTWRIFRLIAQRNRLSFVCSNMAERGITKNRRKRKTVLWRGLSRYGLSCSA